jgi:hypothetical protein
MAQIKKIEFGDGSQVTITDWGDYPLWSRVVIPAATFGTDQAFFQYQSGQAGPGITLSTDLDTNMLANGQLPASHEFLVYSFQIIPDEILGVATTVGETTYAAGHHLPEVDVTAGFQKMNQIFNSLLFQFRIEQSKTYVEGPIGYFPAGGGAHIEHNSAIDGQASEAADYLEAYAIHNGRQGWDHVRRLWMPIYIAGLETFRGTLRAPRGAFNTDTPIDWDFGMGFTCRMTGPRKRPTY